MPKPSSENFCFDIKSSYLSIVNLVFQTIDVPLIAADLDRRFGDVADFFDDDAVSIDLTALALSDVSSVDWVALLALLRKYSMHPVAVRGVGPDDRAMIQSLGLVIQETPSQVTSAIASGASGSAAGETVTAIDVSTTEPAPLGALVIDKPLRSGQRVYAKGRDLVMLAMVNAGAEVIADGHIHVYAPLRGRAIAGARGNLEARIFALGFSPELISIAGVYQSIDGDLPKGVESQVAVASLEVSESGERLIYKLINR